MKRIINIEIENCRACPFLDIVDGYNEYTFVCGKAKMRSNLIDGSPNAEEDAEQTLASWFDKLCPLPARSAYATRKT